MKNTTFVEANTKKKIFLQNLSPMFHLVSEEMILKIFFIFCILVAMATIRIGTGQQNHLPGRESFKEHF